VVKGLNRVGLVLWLVVLGLRAGGAVAQAVPKPTINCPGTVEMYRSQLGYHNCYCDGDKPICDEFKTSSPKGRTKAASQEAQIKSMIVGTIFDSLMSSMSSSGSKAHNPNALIEQQQAIEQTALQAAAQEQAQQRAQEQAFARQKMALLPSFKPLEGDSPDAYKGLADAPMAYKTLDGPLEALAAGARAPFDSASTVAPQSTAVPGQATAFFGDSMPLADVENLVNPGNDPQIVDLRNAVTFVAKNLKDEAAHPAHQVAAPAVDKKAEPRNTPAQCDKLTQQLKSYVTQRQKFQQTILLAQQQWSTWDQSNRNALVNQAKDGIEYFVGNYLGALQKRGLAAKRYEEILERNAANMSRDGIDVLALRDKIERLKASSVAGKVAGLANDANTWQTFLKDGASSLVAQLSTSNDEIKDMMADPRMQKYFSTDAPELNTLLDISKIAADSKVFGKWVARKIPMLALLEISTKTVYNASDWLLSLNRVKEANHINGQVLRSAQSLQKHIDDTSLALQRCQ
jgi:phage shock protein A